MKAGTTQGTKEERRRLSFALAAGAVGASLLVLVISSLWPFQPSAIAFLAVVWWFVAAAIVFLPVALGVAIVAIAGAGFVHSLIKPRAVEMPWTAQESAKDISAPPDPLTALDIQGVDILKNLSLQQLSQIAAIARKSRFPPGAFLARQGDKGNVVYIILEGQVQLTATSGLGDVTIRVVGSGESLPLAALVGSRELISTARAMTEVGAAEIPCAAFFDLYRRQPEIGMEVYRSVADILAARYRSSLSRLTGMLDQALRKEDVFINM